MLFNCFNRPFLPRNCEKPPTIYAILNSIVNGEKEEDEYVNIKDLATNGRLTIFDFDFPLSENVSRETFEKMILNKFMIRRIGFETVTAFKLQLDVRLNEIMPMYNKMFDALENWDIFSAGEITTRTGTDNRTSNTTSESTTDTTNELTNHSDTSSANISDRRNSDTPQNNLGDVRSGDYVSNYNYDTDTANGTDDSTSNGSSNTSNNSNTSNTDNNTYNEVITRTPSDKIAIMKEMQTNIKSIYSMIFDDLECLFYQLV